MTAPADRQPGWRTANRPLPPRPAERTGVQPVAMQPASITAPAAPLPAVAVAAAEVAPSSIPALAEAASASGGPLPPRPVRPRAPAPAAARPAPAPRTAPSAPSGKRRPDAKPMRIVYGAGALAAASVMTVGLVQPDFGAQSDQEPGAVPEQDELAGTDAGGRPRREQRVVRYVFLRPNQDAPSGARVISAGEAAERGVAVPGRARQRSRDANQPARAAQPPDAQPQPQPRPRPAPPVRTHQSG